MRFILAVVDGKLIVSKRKKVDLENELRASNYEALPRTAKAASAAAAAALSEGGEEAEGGAEGAAEGCSYDYLLGMPLWSLTLEKVPRRAGARPLPPALLPLG